ncbi:MULTISPECIES: hypothetical protein [Clostridium]|uniref:Polyketide cyclase n=1 Tax=Clostridium paridis TaxID=2803863 RepID=A0A937FGV0_9CLOT|nr:MULTISPECIES: hypothetical protein [Clostridium]MBL4932027.1 hypothetical protein [Clostridium paridis]
MRERKCEIIAYLKSDVKSVWDVVTNNRDFKWRSDIEGIEIFNEGKEFIEYNKKGTSTKFKITKKREFKEYEFNMENKMFTGFWTGYFFEVENGGTKIIFKENIFIKNPIIALLSYIFMNLNKIQGIYVSDLKKKLGE